MNAAAQTVSEGDLLLRVEAVSKSYRNGSGRIKVLEDISLQVRSGETFGLVGESGAGKTSLAKILCALMPPDEGIVELEGRPVPYTRKLIRSTGFFRRVQLVFQDTYGTLNPYRTVEQNLWEAIENLGLEKEKGKEQMEQLLDRVGFPRSKLTSRPRSLSGGLRQRACIARALLFEPCLLVLDEPVASLDLSVQARILNLLAELKAEMGLSYVLISHDLDVLGQLSDRITVLYQGRIVEQGSVMSMIKGAQHPYSVQLFSSQSRTHRWAQEEL